MITERIFEIIGQNEILRAIIFIVVSIILTEVIYVYLIKRNKRRGDIWTYSVAHKFMAFFISSLLWLALIAVLAVIDLINQNYVSVFVSLGVAFLLVVYFWINKKVAEKYSVEDTPRHKNNFKKGDILDVAVTGRHDGSWNFVSPEKYKFVKNGKYGDDIRVDLYEDIDGCRANRDYYYESSETTFKKAKGRRKKK